MPVDTGAQNLARWVVGLAYEDLPREVVLHAKRCMLDTLGVQIRGATLPWVQSVYQYVRSMAGNGDATVSYYGDRLPIPYAAYVNSTFSYSCELQHTGSSQSGHPGVIVIPTIQALGEQLGSTGQDIITAMVAGYEVQGKLAVALVKPTLEPNSDAQTFGTAMRKRYFHHMLLGVFSTAAAAGKLLGLDEERLAHAFAIAGSHASTIFEYDQSGGEVKRIHGAIATRSGIQSAFLAKAGLTGPLTIFEGRRGIFAAFGGSQAADAPHLFSETGQAYCITRCQFRTYPCIGAQHSTLDLLDALIKEHAFDYRDVESIRVGIMEHAVPHVSAVTRPHDVISSQASLGFSIGVRLVKGSNSLEMYINPELWRDPEVLSVADKLQTYALVKDWWPGAARLEIKLKNGRVLEAQRMEKQKRALSQEDVEDKFRSLAGVMLSRDQVEDIIQTVAQLEQLPAMSQLVPLLQKQLPESLGRSSIS